jgi:hypothetical protein
MRGLAKFAMTGRYRALFIAIASSGSLLFAWVGAAIVALVTLRKGFREGFWLLLWSSLPALLLTRVTGDSSALLLLLGTVALAMVLRGSVNLAVTALASAGVAIATGLGLLVFGEPLLDELARLFAEFFAALEQQASQGGATSLGLQPPTRLQLAGMMGTANGALSFLCLALARYWQAALYNPGGFGVEFRALRFAPLVVWMMAIVALGLASMGLAYRSWGASMLVPLTIAGFALLHARARYRGQGSFWMGAIYAGWLVFDAAKLALVALVLADAIVNFRTRWDLPEERNSNAGNNAGSNAGENRDENREDEREDDRGEGKDKDMGDDDRNPDTKND